jgi:hypothetical protein
MNILIACEYSGVIRDAFTKLGHNSTSCDLLSSDTPGNHYKGDVFDIINEPWDLMIAHPPCTYLSYAGMDNWYDEGRAFLRIKAAEFFIKLWQSNIKHICIENPQGIMNKIFRQPDQVIHPYYFGEREMKRTCLWLKNLPLLTYYLQDDFFNKKTASEIPKPNFIALQKSTGKLKKRYFTDNLINGRFKTSQEKSKSFISIANAMATQWGLYISTLKK